jgi:ribosomal protein S18 acetylase RimI-like enzyme
MRRNRESSRVIEPAREDELAAAIRLAFRHLDSQDRETRLTNALEMIRRKELNPAGIIVVREAAGLRGALICQPMPGASGLIWPPQTIPRNHRDTEAQLIQFACRWLAGEGAKLVQSLLLPEESGLARPLEHHGFAKITRLCYLRHQLNLPATSFQEAERLIYQFYDSCESELFHQTLLRTYEQTLDCPEVSGVRTVEEIIAGHKSQGIHNPRHWWLAFQEGRPAGILLLAEMVDGKGWDILYLGVVPEARRQGFGRELIRKALREAKSAAAPQLTLAVDARNRPAYNLYQQLGFEAFDEREVYLRRLKQALPI